MATTYWVGAAEIVAQIDTLTVTTAILGGTITAILGTSPNQVAITYTCVTGETTSTAAAALQALLDASQAPQVSEITWTVSGAVITGTAGTPGTPFNLAASAAGGAAMNRTASVANVSPSDANNAQNWRRSGAASLPQNNDDVVVSGSDVPILWNLDALAAVQFASFTRWQSFTGTIGLPDWNPNGYYEYRPKYFQFIGNASPIQVLLGNGPGEGPGRERYNVGAQMVTLTVLATGSPLDDYSVYFLGTSVSSGIGNVLNISGASVVVALSPGETSGIASATVDGGGSLTLGAGVTFSGTLTATNAALTLYCAPAIVNLYSGSQGVVYAPNLLYSAINVWDGSTLTWLTDSDITTLSLLRNSTLDAGGDTRPVSITNSTMTGDSIIQDPNNRIIFGTATVMTGIVQSGPFIVGPNRTFRVT